MSIISFTFGVYANASFSLNSNNNLINDDNSKENAIAENKLESAIIMYQQGVYAEASIQLERLIYPIHFTKTKDIIRAKVYLGLCYYLLDKKDQAIDEFKDIFRMQPNFQPDPLYIPQDICQFIESLQPKIDINSTKTSRLEKATKKTSFSPLAILPLGIPQFYANKKVKGSLILASQISFFALNTGSYYYLSKNNTSANGKDFLDRKTYRRLYTLKILNFASLALLTTSVVYGVSDGIIIFSKKKQNISLNIENPFYNGFGLSYNLKF